MIAIIGVFCYNEAMNTLKKMNLFWDIDQNELDHDKHGIFIVKRILEKGDVDDIDWAMKSYGKEFMEDVFQKNTGKFDLKSSNFWCFYFNLDKSQCIRKQSMKKQGPFWQR